MVVSVRVTGGYGTPGSEERDGGTTTVSAELGTGYEGTNPEVTGGGPIGVSETNVVG